MEIDLCRLPGVRVLKPRRFGDNRGWFCEVWNARRATTFGIGPEFVQDNVAFSAAVGTLRGLHFQRPLSAQGKLVWVNRGSILDVALDIRLGSPTFGQHVAVMLTAENGEQIWIPMGFAHGYCTTSPDTQVMYKVTAFYDPSAEAGVRFDDPDLAIRWPVDTGSAHLSEKDQCLPRLAEIFSPFVWEGAA